MGIGYSVKPDPDKTARALGRELEVKPRHAIEVCRALRGLTLVEARELMEGVVEQRKAIPYRRHLINAGHRKGTGPGGYPVKTAKAVLKLLAQAEANAEYKGLETDRLVVRHAAAQRAGVVPGQMPRARGRATPWNKQITHIELVLEEVES